MQLPESLSPRQKQILELAAEGRTDKEIAHMTGLSAGTIRTYWDRLRQRFDARSRMEVLSKACVNSTTETHVYREILEKLPLFIWTADPSGYVDWVNEWFETEGMIRKEACLGLGCRALMPSTELPESAERWAHAQETGQPYEALVHFRCGQFREPLRHKIRLMPVRDGSGRVVKWIGYGRLMAENADAAMATFLRSVFAAATPADVSVR